MFRLGARLAAVSLATSGRQLSNPMPDDIRSFEDLKCWKAAREFRLFVAKEVLPRLPKGERFRLGDQLLRAARSITANIAEGYGRFHYLDNTRFCSVARDRATKHLSTSSQRTTKE